VSPPTGQIKAIEKPAQLLYCEHHRRSSNSGPAEAFSLQALLPEHQTVALPHQELAPVTPATVGNSKILGRKGVELELTLDLLGKSIVMSSAATSYIAGSQNMGWRQRALPRGSAELLGLPFACAPTAMQ
jgi:hypothetical protein